MAINAQLIDYNQLAGSYGIRKLSKKIGRSINYQDQQVQSSGNYDQPQIGGGYQQAPAIASSSGYQQPIVAEGYQQSANTGYQQENKQAAATYQNENPAAGGSTYGQNSNSGSSNAYDTAKVKMH